MAKRTIITTGKILIALVVVTSSFSLKITSAESPSLTREEQHDILMDAWIDRLAFCESRGNPNAINPHDSGSPSYGLLQFKLGTFWSYSKKYGTFPEMTMDRLHEYATDPEKQRILAKEIVSREKYGWKNWYNCTVKSAGLPPVME